MRLSVHTAVSAVALVSTGILAAFVASGAISTERQHRSAAKKAANKLRERAQ
jgi:hypothetical protein